MMVLTWLQDDKHRSSSVGLDHISIIHAVKVFVNNTIIYPARYGSPRRYAPREDGCCLLLKTVVACYYYALRSTPKTQKAI